MREVTEKLRTTLKALAALPRALWLTAKPHLVALKDGLIDAARLAALLAVVAAVMVLLVYSFVVLLLFVAGCGLLALYHLGKLKQLRRDYDDRR